MLVLCVSETVFTAFESCGLCDTQFEDGLCPSFPCAVVPSTNQWPGSVEETCPLISSSVE